MSTTLKLTLAEYDRMIAQGIFDETRDRRIELIYGELRETSRPGPPHEYLIDLLNEWSFRNVPADHIRIRVQNSVGIPPLDSAPQPDVVWVKRKSYRHQRPQPEDVLLIIEVSESTLDYDRITKSGLYAEAGFADYWVVNVPAQCIEVFRNPQEGKYQDVRSVGKDESVRPVSFPDVELPVSLLFDV